MKLSNIMQQRHFVTHEGLKLEIYSKFMKRNHITKRCFSVIHCYIKGSPFNIPLSLFKKAIKDKSIKLKLL